MSAEQNVEARIGALLVRADELFKAAAAAVDADAARGRVQQQLEQARDLLPEVVDTDQRLDLAAAVAQRIGDLDEAELAAHIQATDGVSPAPTRGIDPERIPAGQRLTPGFPVLHVGAAPNWAASDVEVKVTGLVDEHRRFDLPALQELPQTTMTTDFHCVTRWSRMDTTWTGVRVRDVLDAVWVGDTATHALVYGHPAYSANFSLEALRRDNVLLAWQFDGEPLPQAHGGPLRLVVPALYGWKSVKWVTQIQLLGKNVPGYWEERGYHDVGDPWQEQRFR